VATGVTNAWSTLDVTANENAHLGSGENPLVVFMGTGWELYLWRYDGTPEQIEIHDPVFPGDGRYPNDVTARHGAGFAAVDSFDGDPCEYRWRDYGGTMAGRGRIHSRAPTLPITMRKSVSCLCRPTTSTTTAES
jgi:hypothetical protein